MKTLQLRAVSPHLTTGLMVPLLLAVAGCGDDEAARGSGGGGAGSSSTTATTTGGTTSGATTSSATTAATTGGGGGGGEGGGGEGGGTSIDGRLADCLRIDACEADGGTPIGVEACLAAAFDEPWAWASVGPSLLALQVLECKRAAPDCEAVRACSPDPAGFAEACLDNPGLGICEGDVWVFCDELGEPITAMDCGAAGQSCGTDIWAGCGTERCEFGVTEASCDPQDTAVLVECSAAGFLTRVDCRTQNNFVLLNGPEGEEVFTIAGEVCGQDEQRGTLGCIGTGESCDFFAQDCVGDVLETCAGGLVGRRDCGELSPEGQSCGFVAEGPFAGGAACGLVEPTCTLGEGDEVCDAGTIEICGYQGPTRVDCIAAGYAGCGTAERGGRTIAFCTE